MCSFGSQKFTSGLKSLPFFLRFLQCISPFHCAMLRGSGYTFFHNPMFAKRFISPKNHISRPASRFSLKNAPCDWKHLNRCSAVPSPPRAPAHRWNFLPGFVRQRWGCEVCQVRLIDSLLIILVCVVASFRVVCLVLLKKNMYHVFETLINYCILSDSTALTVKFQPLMWWCSMALQPSTFVMWLFFTAVRNLRGSGGEATRNPSDFRAPFLLQLFFAHTEIAAFFGQRKKALPFFWTEGHLYTKAKSFFRSGNFRRKTIFFRKNPVSRFFWYYAMTQLFHMGVSKNSGTPKSSILIGFSIINHPFWGTPIVGNTHIFLCCSVGHRLRGASCDISLPKSWTQASGSY